MGMPNLCVCKGWDSPVKNSTELMPFVEFAVGQINNMISDASPTGKCKRLVPTSFENVMQRKQGENVRLSFDIVTSPGKGSKNKEERFNVAVSYKKNEKLSNSDTKVLSKDRVSTFGNYHKCSDADNTFRFCVCNMNEPKVLPKLVRFDDLSPARLSYIYKFVGTDELILEYVRDKLGLLIRKTFLLGDDGESQLVSASFETINLSQTDRYVVTVFFPKMYNLQALTNSSCTGTAMPNSMLYLCTLSRKLPVLEGEFEYEFSHRKV